MMLGENPEVRKSDEIIRMNRFELNNVIGSRMIFFLVNNLNNFIIPDEGKKGQLSIFFQFYVNEGLKDHQ